MNEIDFLQQAPKILFIDSIKTSKDITKIVNQACSNFSLVILARYSDKDENFVELDKAVRRSGVKNLQVVDMSRQNGISLQDRAGQIIRSCELASGLMKSGIFISSNMEDASDLNRSMVIQSYLKFFRENMHFGRIEGLSSTFTMILDGTSSLRKSNIGELLVVRH
jgi:hypothetical protein